jgi:peptide/nickel transport system ATP-binding protein
VLGLLPRGTRVSGSLRVAGEDMVNASAARLRNMRGLVAGYVSQDPFGAFNPLLRVGRSVAEAWHAHGIRPRAGAVAEALERLGIPDASRRARLWPHQWSGGMLQRATIAAAAAHSPRLIVADEPTSALDADLGYATLEVLRSTGTAVLLVSHDMAMVHAHADLMAVCYAGRLVEVGSTVDVLERPRHPYTSGLLAAIPRPGRGLPTPLEGSPPSLRSRDPGCAFAPRCSLARDDCHRQGPAIQDGVACPVVMGGH